MSQLLSLHWSTVSLLVEQEGHTTTTEEEVATHSVYQLILTSTRLLVDNRLQHTCMAMGLSTRTLTF